MEKRLCAMAVGYDILDGVFCAEKERIFYRETQN